MARLLLMRHGKSDWEAAYGGDHERPLASRGRLAARAMGRFLTAADLQPALAIVSSAVRARTTAEIAAEAGGWSCRIEVRESLYLAPPQEVLELVRQCNDEVEPLLVVGHEPTSSQLLSLLTGGTQARFPTAAIVCVETHVSRWAQLRPGAGQLRWLVTPKLVQLGLRHSA